MVHWLADRGEASSPEPPGSLYQELLDRVEPALLEEVMRRLRPLQGNRLTAAQWLGLNRATAGPRGVRKKLALYHLSDASRDGTRRDGTRRNKNSSNQDDDETD